MSPKPKILIIVGPTAGGKTALALRLAKGKPVSIISADSRQVYKGLDVLTGKDIPPTTGTIRLFGFDLIKPDQTMNAAQYSDRIRAIIDSEIKENRQVIIVGGTGFYLKALTQPAALAKVAPDEKLRQKLNHLSVDELQQKLKDIDPGRLAAMNRSDVNNPRRLIRAIEVSTSTSTPGESGVPSTPGVDQVCTPRVNFHWIGLTVPLEVIKDRVRLRVNARLDTAVSEVKELIAAYPDRSLPIYTSLGVKQILKYLAGEISREEMKDGWVTDEVNYAKRQLTWFAKQPSIIWYDQEEVGKLSLDKLI